MNLIFFAAAMDDDPLPGFGPMGLAAKERLIVLGAVALVLAIVLGWALLFRHRRRRAARREDRRHRRHSFAKNAAKGVAEIKQLVKEHQHRRRRRHHRPRNPTLAETGGLPPPRSDDQPPQTQPH